MIGYRLCWAPLAGIKATANAKMSVACPATRRDGRRRLRLRNKEAKVRSKPDTVDQPVRTARIFVHHYNSTHYCDTETVFIYIPLPPDQHHISDVAKEGRGGGR